MKMLREQLNAEMLVSLIQYRLAKGTGPIHGYHRVAELIGYENGHNAARAMGAVTSRVDHACVMAGLPPICVHWVRNAEGDVNPDSFPGAQANGTKPQLFHASRHRNWSRGDFMAIKNQLMLLEQKSVRKLWRNVGDEQRQRRQRNIIRDAE